MSAVVKSLSRGSMAYKAGVRRGDTVLYINGREINDILDYKFAAADEELLITLKKPDGSEREIKILNSEFLDLGMGFAGALFDGARRCKNKCIFCFVDQLPKGMRETLYFKDDDARLSFLQGNYITLTNLTENDIDRIKEMRLSPVNISVHTTNPELREAMLRNPKAGAAMEIMRSLAAAGISMNLQIVLCRGLNDGGELDKTIGELAQLFPAAQSLSVVPVGITRYREGLFKLTPYDSESAGEVIDQVFGWQKKLLKKIGARFVFAADEFFITAGRKVPAPHEYEGFLQLENGVGLLSDMRAEFLAALDKKPEREPGASIITGVAAAEFLKGLVKTATDRYGGEIDVFAVENRFFGPLITVAGLVTGRDIIRALSGKGLRGKIIIPSVMLKSGEEVFLDDITVSELERELGAKITVSGAGGGDLWRAINSLED